MFFVACHILTHNIKYFRLKYWNSLRNCQMENVSTPLSGVYGNIKFIYGYKLMA